MPHEQSPADVAQDVSQSVIEDGEPIAPLPPEAWPDMSDVVTEDDTPVDNIFSEKQQRLLIESLYSSWAGPAAGRAFLALANVGLFYAVNTPPLVPDMLLSLDVQAPADVWQKQNRSYVMWMYGKPPDLVLEVVSNTSGGELSRKYEQYARLGISYYVVFDPLQQLQPTMLQVYERRALSYTPVAAEWLEPLQLGLTLWEGEYAGVDTTWLRWHDHEQQLIATGAEQRQRAEQERQRAEKLAARLREMGIDPDA